MSRRIRLEAISPFGALIILFALLAAPLTFPSIISKRIAAESPTNRLRTVGAAVLNTSVSTLADQEEGSTESTPGDITSEEVSAYSGASDNLEGTIGEDTVPARAAKLAQSTLRKHIELYRQQHNGVNPLSTLIDLTQCTNARGVAGPGFQFGPYLREIPENPITKSAAVKPITSDPATTENLTPGGGGWLYNAKTGNIWLDHPDFLAQ